MLCSVVSCCVLFSCVVLCVAVFFCVLLCCVLLCFVVLCCVVLCFVVLCCVVLCCGTPVVGWLAQLLSQSAISSLLVGQMSVDH